MNFEEALVAELSAITALNGRVFPQNAPEETEPPFVVYVSSEGERIQTLEGYTDLTELSFDVHVVTKTYEELKGLAKAVLDRIRSFFGRAIGDGEIVIKSVTYFEPTEDYEEERDYHSSTISARVRF